MSADDHGSVSTYTNHGCRCEECRKVTTEWHRTYMHRTGRQRPWDEHLAVRRDKTLIEHGTESGYVNLRCRCSACRNAATEARRFRRLATARAALLPPKQARRGAAGSDK